MTVACIAVGWIVSAVMLIAFLHIAKKEEPKP